MTECLVLDEREGFLDLSADQRVQALSADCLGQPSDGRIAAEKQVCLSRSEIGQPRIGARRNRLTRAIGGGRPLRGAIVDCEILDVNGAGPGDALDLATAD